MPPRRLPLLALLGLLALPLAAQTPIVDPNFAPQPALAGAPSALLSLPDGKLLVADSGAALLVRLQPDGTRDLSFTPVAVASVRRLVLAGNGHYYVGGGFSTVNGTARPGLARLTPNGTLDPSFAPATSLGDHAITDLVEQADGKLVVARGTPRLVRLLADGANDAGFTPAALPDGTFEFGIERIALDGAGRIYAAGSRSDVPHRRGGLGRFASSGALDSSFPVRNVGMFHVALRTLSNEHVALVTYSYHSGSAAVFQRHLRHYAPDGTTSLSNDFPTMVNVSGNFTFELGWTAAHIYPDGRTLIAGDFTQLDGYRRAGFARLTAEGALDLAFSPGITPPEPVTTLAVGADGLIYAGGEFSFYNGVAQPHLVRLNVVTSEGTSGPSAATLALSTTSARPGDTVTLTASAEGSPPRTYEWYRENAGGRALVAVTAVPQWSFTVAGREFGTFPDDGNFSVKVRNAYEPDVQSHPNDGATSPALALEVNPPALALIEQPTQLSSPTGRDLTLAVTAADGFGVLYEWRREGQIISPASTLNRLTLENVTAADAGVYSVTLLREEDDTQLTSAPITVTVDDVARFVNLSTRTLAGPGERTTILGFALDTPPNVARRVLIRGVGPGMNVTLPGRLADPRLTIYDANQTVVASNDDWASSGLTAGDFDAIGAFALPPGSRDAALVLTTSQRGTYTVHLTGADPTPGLALIELYENDRVAHRIVNLSTRAYVGLGDAVAIPGFFIAGSTPKRVLVRAVGPALTGLVNEPLANPHLTLFGGMGIMLASNDDWAAGTASEVEALEAAFAAAGAFPLPRGSADAALVVTLPPGGYTAIATGVNDTTGVALVEVYELP